MGVTPINGHARTRRVGLFRWTPVGAAIALLACQGDAPPPTPAMTAAGGVEVNCTLAGSVDLPRQIVESSGLALSAVHPGVLWTLNDSGRGPFLFAIDSTGALLATVRVAGAQNRDWEDLAQAPCAEGSCLYIADVGDNLERRDHVRLYRIPEPALSDTMSAPAEALRFTYPDRPRNVEAAAVSPGGTAYLIAKWGDHAIYTLPVTGGETVLQATKLHEFRIEEDLTGASFSPDGRWLVIRGYNRMFFFRPLENEDLELVGDAAGIDLRPLREPGGEAVAVRSDGTVFLTSEGTSRRPPMLSRVNCVVS